MNFYCLQYYCIVKVKYKSYYSMLLPVSYSTRELGRDMKNTYFYLTDIN